MVTNILGKLFDIVSVPVTLINDWAHEPLKRREHQRQIDRDAHLRQAELDSKLKEATHASNIETAHKKLDVDLEVRRQTEVHRIMVEIDELRKDKEFQRMKLVSDAIMQYQENLTRLNINAISAIGSMQLDLREKAQNLVYEKTIKYKELQDSAHHQAYEEIVKIEEAFSGNETAKTILYKSVETRMVSIITTAQNFLIELNNDIAVLNKSINLLTERGQTFIQEHLSQFHVVSNGGLLDGSRSDSSHALLEDREN